MKIINTLNVIGGLAICGLAGKKKGRTMNPLIQLKQTTSVFLVAFGLACFGLSPTMRAVSPAPDGGYPNENTAGGIDALLHLSFNNVGGNTAIGFEALKRDTDGVQNTAVGDRALSSNTVGNFNTAVGLSALGANQTGSDNTAIGWGCTRRQHRQ